MSKTAIITPLWNHLEDIIKPFVEAMLKTEGEWELVLVDNGSTDGTSQYLKKIRDRRIKKVYLKKNTGFGGGNNAGYKKISADVDRVCFLSNDVIVQGNNWLQVLNQHLDRNPGSLIGPQYVDYNTLTSFEGLPTPYIAGWCMFAERKLFDRLRPNVFDKAFPVAYFEDVWLSVKAVDYGYDLLGVPVPIEHMGSKSSDQIDIPFMAKKNQMTFWNKMMIRQLHKKKQKRIIFFAGNCKYPFVDEDYEGRGVGGSEASLIQLSREFAKAGWRVEIYNKTDISGIFNGVRYHGADELIPAVYTDVFVLFREWHPVVEVINTRLNLFWSCDQVTDMPGIWNAKVFPHIDCTVSISPYHEKFLKDNYKALGRVRTIELGVKWRDYAKPEKKVYGRAIYCSVPMRGLKLLAETAPLIKARVPEFELIITSDYRLWGLVTAENQDYRNLFEPLESYVKFLGKVDRKTLVHYQKTSQVMAYPCTYEECFCISALECLAAGAIPVTSNLGALPTTVGKAGILLSSSELGDEFVDWVVELFNNQQKRLKLEHLGRKRAESRSWDKVFAEWELLISEETNMARRKVATETVTHKAVTAPQVGLPRFTMLRFTRPVEFAINGRNFATKPQKAWHQVEVPYELVTQAMLIIRDVYGTEIIVA